MSDVAKPPLFILNEPARLLLVDDDAIFREFASVHLSSPVASVVTAADGEAAWSRLQDEAFDLLLVDVEMPRMDGFELVTRVRADARMRHVPIIMITGRDDIRSIDRAYAVGATSFIAKPVNWRQCAYQVRYVLRMSRAEASARIARDRAEELSTLKSNLLSIMRHEFRTPVSAIMGFSDMIRKEVHGPLDPRYTHYAELVGDAGALLLRMHIDMMNYALLQSGEYAIDDAEYELTEIIRSAVTAAKATGGTPPTIRLDVEEHAITCDREQMVRLLQHLLDNAIVHGGGDVRVDAHVGTSGTMAIAIVDQGPGFPAEHLDSCFEPFPQGDMRLNRERPGLGLGLPIAKRIADLHGGTLTIASTGIGTSVRLTLPASRILSAAVAAA